MSLEVVEMNNILLNQLEALSRKYGRALAYISVCHDNSDHTLDEKIAYWDNIFSEEDTDDEF